MTRPGPPEPLAAMAAALRRERERAGLSLTALAKRAGVAKSTLSQLESGAGNPSVETLWAIGVALDVPLSRLVEPPSPQVRVVRSGTGLKLPSEAGEYVGVLLSASPPHARRDLYVVALEPGTVRRADPHIPGTVEHLVVSTGRIRLGPVDDVVDVGPGDYVSFPGDVPHTYEALAPGSTCVLVMEHA